MTDSQDLLAEYRRNGSDAAFRELVVRFVDFVYSTAHRLVEGDTHRAEDVTQIVFVDLARQARTLSHEVRLGGWLHRRGGVTSNAPYPGQRVRHVDFAEATGIVVPDEFRVSETASWRFVQSFPEAKPPEFSLKCDMVALLLRHE